MSDMDTKSLRLVALVSIFRNRGIEAPEEVLRLILELMQSWYAHERRRAMPRLCNINQVGYPRHFCDCDSDNFFYWRSLASGYVPPPLPSYYGPGY